MKRRSFFKNGALAALGGLVLPSFDLQAQTLGETHKNKRTKNNIFMVSDGMSFGTLVMADLYLKRGSHFGKVGIFSLDGTIRAKPRTARRNGYGIGKFGSHRLLSSEFLLGRWRTCEER